MTLSSSFGTHPPSKQLGNSDSRCNLAVARQWFAPGCQEVDKLWWPTSLDAASNQKLKGAMVEFIDKSLPNTLRQMEVTN